MDISPVWRLRDGAEHRRKGCSGPQFCELLTSPVDDASECARGGLPPMVVRRVEQLIAEAKNRSDSLV